MALASAPRSMVRRMSSATAVNVTTIRSET